MRVFRGSIVINKPVETVTKLFLDKNYIGEYQDGFQKKELIDGKEGDPGCKSTLYYKYGNRDMILTETILRNDLPEEFEAFYHHVHMDNTMKCSFTSIGDSTTRYDYEYTRINWFLPKLMFLLFPGMYKKQGDKWQQQFKAFVEQHD